VETALDVADEFGVDDVVEDTIFSTTSGAADNGNDSDATVDYDLPAFFFNMIDIAAYNALVLLITANPNWHRGKLHARRLFLRELDMSLTESHASERLTQPSGKRRRIQACARRSGILADRSSLAYFQSTMHRQINTIVFMSTITSHEDMFSLVY